MKVPRVDGIIRGMYSSTIIEKFVIDRHVVVKEVKLSISGLLHVHLRHPVVGKIQGNVTTI